MTPSSPIIGRGHRSGVVRALRVLAPARSASMQRGLGLARACAQGAAGLARSIHRRQAWTAAQPRSPQMQHSRQPNPSEPRGESTRTSPLSVPHEKGSHDQSRFNATPHSLTCALRPSRSPRSGIPSASNSCSGCARVQLLVGGCATSLSARQTIAPYSAPALACTHALEHAGHTKTEPAAMAPRRSLPTHACHATYALHGAHTV